MLYLVSAGYIITYNATEYEFDISVYSSVGTVVFEALLIAEDISDFVLIMANFAGDMTSFDPFSINEMETEVRFDGPIRTNLLLTITLNEALDLNDSIVDYSFTINYSALAVDLFTGSVNIILHEIGKSYAYSIHIVLISLTDGCYLCDCFSAKTSHVCTKTEIHFIAQDHSYT